MDAYSQVLGYDPSNEHVYIVTVGSASISVIDNTSVIANIDVVETPVSIAYDPMNGCIYVVNSGSVSLSIINTYAQYVVSFIESASARYYVSVTLDGQTKYSSHSTITFNVTAGTYNYSITPISGYSVMPSSGTITITSNNLQVQVTFKSLPSPPTTSPTPPSSPQPPKPINVFITPLTAVILVALIVIVLILIMRRKTYGSKVSSA